MLAPSSLRSRWLFDHQHLADIALFGSLRERESESWAPTLGGDGIDRVPAALYRRDSLINDDAHSPNQCTWVPITYTYLQPTCEKYYPL